MRDPFLLLGAAPRPGFRIEDLPGLRLGLVSEVPTPVWCLRGDVAARGMEWDALTAVTDQGMAANAAAVVAGQLDLAQMFEPFACRVEDAGGAVWHAQASRGHTAYTAFYATEAGIAAKREPLQAMIRAMAEALDFIRAAPAAEVAGADRAALPGCAGRSPHARHRPLPGAEPLGCRARLPARGLRDAGPRHAGLRRHRHIPAFADCVDNALVEEALA